MKQPDSRTNSANGNRRFGIREQIRHADSTDEIDNLLRQLASAQYANASDQTRASCHTAARKRRKELAQ